MWQNKQQLVLNLNLFFLSLLALVAQTVKALSRVWDIFSCNFSSSSKSSTQVSSWLSRCRRTALLPVDCVASLEKLSEWSRPVVLNTLPISSMFYQSVKCRQLKVCSLHESLSVESVGNHLQVLAVSVETPSGVTEIQAQGFGFWFEECVIRTRHTKHNA